MTRLALNKSALHAESRKLKTYRRFLPSLELKRKQIMAERSRAQAERAQLQQHIETLLQRGAAELPMLGRQQDDALAGLVRLSGVTLAEENLVGVRLPVLREVQLQRASYSLLCQPHWIDTLAELLAELIELRLRVQVADERLRRLQQALTKTTQRLNLFDKVLIPRTEQHIRKIKIVLSDAERAGVVRAKLAKNKRRRGGDP